MRPATEDLSSSSSAAASAWARPEERCRRLHEALCACERRLGGGRRGRGAGDRSSSSSLGCRHLNRALGECMVEGACPEEWEAVRALCSSGGTHLKRAQCLQAQSSLSSCLSSLQQQLLLPPSSSSRS